LIRPQEFERRNGFLYSKRFLYELVRGIPVGAICVEKGVFERVNGFDPELRCWEVTDFWCRVMLESQTVGFSTRDYVVIHHDPANSQYEKTRTCTGYRTRYLSRTLGVVARLPFDQQQFVLGETQTVAKELLESGARAEAREILRDAVRLWPHHPHLTLLRILTYCPKPHLRRLIKNLLVPSHHS
jgi:hypothetical protein